MEQQQLVMFFQDGGLPTEVEDEYEEDEYVEPEFITLPDGNYQPSRVREIISDPSAALGFRLVLPSRPYSKPSDVPLHGEHRYVYIRRDTESVRICDILPIVGYNITDHYLTLSTEYVRRT